MTRIQIDFYSNSLYENTQAYVILPNSQKDFLANGVRRNEEGKLKVLWLLHGMGDDHTSWIRNTNLERYALARGIAVVCPSVPAQSFYSDMVNGPKCFRYISEELPAFMRETFPQLSDKKEDNYIMGQSMGGYGSLKVGLSFPERYQAIGVLSSGNLIEMELPPQTEEENFLTPIYGVGKNAFGKKTMKDALGTKHDILHLLEEALREGKEIPDIRMVCGTEDFIKGVSDTTADFMKKKAEEHGFAFTYETGPGEHNWDFWDRRLPVLLDEMGLTSLL
jgi:S-formylglutathione hydrolase FrmB